MPIIELLTQLVKFPTVSSQSNLSLINYIEHLLQQHNIKAKLYYNKNQQKANLFANLTPHLPKQTNGIILSGHTDVVPVTNQNWLSDPFNLSIKNGNAYGRGAVDMKGFIAVVLSLLPKFYQAKRPIYLALSYDEEVGCTGVIDLINQLADDTSLFAGCIVGEPSNMDIISGHKGINLYRCNIGGKAAHSSLTNDGCNAIEFASQLIGFINKISTDLQQQGYFDNNYDVPYTTISTNLINGGNAVNIIPSECEITYEIRNLPNDNAQNIQNKIETFAKQQILPLMQQKFNAATIHFQTLVNTPGLNDKNNQNFITSLQPYLPDSKIAKVSYATEAGLFDKIGIPTIVCGPGSIKQAHIANEFISLEQLQKYQQFLIDLCKLDK